MQGVGAHVPTAVFSAQLHVKPDSDLDGITLKEVLEKTKQKMRILEIRRGEDSVLARLPSLQLRAGDRLLIEDTAANVKTFAEILDAELHDSAEQQKQGGAETEANSPEAVGEKNRREGAPDRVLAEIIITKDSPLTGISLSQSHFAQTYGLIVVGIRRSSTSADVRRDDIVDLILSAEDVLLVQGTEAQLSEVKQANIGLVLDMRLHLPRADKAILALSILGLVVAATAFKLAPISLSALCGVLALLATGCLKWRDVSAALSIKVALLVAASLALA